jgi:UDP-MurNAc hydroxylase
MKVTLIADSCFLFEHEDVRILTDPWIGTRIAGGAWIQFPRPTMTASEVGRLDYIFISHIHQDHCDLATIEQLDRSAKIVLFDRQPNYVKKFLLFHKLEFAEIICLPPRQRLQIEAGIELEVLEADPAHKLNHLIDSSLLIHYEGKAVFFGNDNPPYPAIYDYVNSANIELAILPPCGGSGYPAFYSNLSESEKKNRSHEILIKYLTEALDCLRALSPRYFMWAANGHVLAGAQAMATNLMSWPKSGNLPYDFVKSRAQVTDDFQPLLLKPGMTVDLDDITDSSLEDAIQFYDDEAERQKFLRDEAKSSNTYFFQGLPHSTGVNLTKLLTVATERLRTELARNAVDLPWRYEFCVDESLVGAIFLQPPYELVCGSREWDGNRLRLSMDQRVFVALLTGLFSWNIADATGFVTYDRDPDEYIFDMYIMLNHLRI